MPVYLEVAPTAARAAQVLEGSECLVFYLGGSPTSGTRHTSGVNVFLCDGSVRFAKDLNEIVAALARTPIAAFTNIIIGQSVQVGYATTRWQLTAGSKQVPSLGLTSTGGPAILIGLLLPAVQAAREAAKTKAPTSGPLGQLKTAAGAGGHVFVIGSNGQLLSL